MMRVIIKLSSSFLFPMWWIFPLLSVQILSGGNWIKSPLIKIQLISIIIILANKLKYEDY
ncbi:MAG: hypothetical protein ACR5KW_02140 [Wolbachia sp.]